MENLTNQTKLSRVRILEQTENLQKLNLKMAEEEEEEDGDGDTKDGRAKMTMMNWVAQSYLMKMWN